MAHSIRTRNDLDSLDVDSPTFGADYNRIYSSILAEIKRAYAAVRRCADDDAVARWQSAKGRYGDALVECAIGGNY